jgi:hypothetical protein
MKYIAFLMGFLTIALALNGVAYSIGLSDIRYPELYLMITLIVLAISYFIAFGEP